MNIEKNVIVLDTETTGLDAGHARLIEVAAIWIKNGKVFKRFDTLVNPGVKIPEAVVKITGINQEMVAEAPEEKEAMDRFARFLGPALQGKIIVAAHNAPFDMGFIRAAFDRAGIGGRIVWLDTLEFSRATLLNLPSYSQPFLCSWLNIENSKEHRAISDAEACACILFELVRQRRPYLERRQIR